MHYLILTFTEKKQITGKLSYRKDDRAMRPMYGCPENFRESLTIRPRLLFPKSLMDFCSDGPGPYECTGDWRNLKFVALPVPGIIGGRLPPKMCTVSALSGYAHAPFSLKFLTGFCSDGPCECIGQI